MAGITDQDIDKYKSILMYDDETVTDAAVALRDAKGLDWWHLVVDLGGGAYAAGTFSALTESTKKEGKDFLDKTLGSLVGTTLTKVDIVADQMKDDPAPIKDKAATSPSKVAVILKDGEYRGYLPAGVTRAAGLFDSSLVQLAGQHAKLPDAGLLGGKRRMEAMAKKKAK